MRGASVFARLCGLGRAVVEDVLEEDYKEFRFKPENKPFLVSLLNSSLFYWYWRAYSDGFHCASLRLRKELLEAAGVDTVDVRPRMPAPLDDPVLVVDKELGELFAGQICVRDHEGSCAGLEDPPAARVASVGCGRPSSGSRVRPP